MRSTVDGEASRTGKPVLGVVRRRRTWRFSMLDVQVAVTPATSPDAVGLLKRLKYYLNPYDSRYEDLRGPNLALNVLRDFTAGLIVAMVAIPLAMGFAMASGLRPEQGIVGGAVAGMIGALWGGSKYQVYGPTAAFIPIIASLMSQYDHGMLVMAAIGAGIILMLLGVTRMGRIVAKVPHSIIVGFSIGIAVTIAMSQIGEVLGIKAEMGYGVLDKLRVIAANLDSINVYAVLLGLITFLLTKYILKISVFIPAPLLALAVTTGLATTIWAGAGVSSVQDKYGRIPTDFWVFTPPALPSMSGQVLTDLAYYIVAIVFVSAIESLLCSRMADRLADNKGTPFNPNKELWGQGLVQIVVPLLNGFPHTGALARTATNIKVGALSPLAGVFKFALKLILALYLARYLELVPMACIGGILLYVATAMVKPAEIREVLAQHRLQVVLMGYTAVAVVLTDFLTGVLSALVIWGIANRIAARRARASAPVTA